MTRMKEFARVVLLTALALCGLSAFAQQPGTTVTYTIPANVYICPAQGTSALNCMGIPFSENGQAVGTAWLYASYNAFKQQNYIWALFSGSSPLTGSEAPGAYQDQGTQWGFSPAQISVHSGYPYGYTTYPCEQHLVPVFNPQTGTNVPEELPNCSTFTGTVSGVTTGGASFTATVTIDFWYYSACSGGRGGCRTNAVVTGGTIEVTYQ